MSGFFSGSVTDANALDVKATVADQTERYALTTATVQNGDTVYQTDTTTLYLVVDDANLDGATGYQQISGFATSTHAHAASDITSGTLVHERGGLEADVSAYSGLLKISGGSTSQATAGTDYALPKETTSGVTAATTQSQGQGAITVSTGVYDRVYEVSTCATANDTVTLPADAVGLTVLIINNGAETLQVFPASGDTIDGLSANASTTISASSRKTFCCYEAGFWSV